MERKEAKITKSKVFTASSLSQISEWLREQALAGYEYIASTPLDGCRVIIFVKEV
jgi:hypothetical protein